MSPKPKSLEERFWPKVRKTSKCWYWTGSRYDSGYGRIRSGGRGTKHVRAHRVSWQLHFGEIPDDLGVLHKCDTPLCVRPDHLFLGTLLDNIKDMIKKGRGRCGSPKGEKNVRAKLTNKKVLRIRSLLRTKSRIYLANKFHVSYSTICRIANNTGWSHI